MKTNLNLRFVRKLFTVVSVGIVAGTFFFGLSACSYSLGIQGKLPFTTVEIAPIVNNADLPQAQATLARDIADTLNRSPKLSTVIENGGAELEVVIEDYYRNIAATSSEDSVLASVQRVTLDLNCSLRNTRSGSYFFRNCKVSVSTDVYAGTSPGLSESQSFPVLSREAARKIRDLIVSVW